METLLKDFCSRDTESPGMVRPWLRHGVVRATNGHILIHIPEHLMPEGHSVEPNDDAPDSDNIFNNILLFTDSFALDARRMAVLCELIASKQSVYGVAEEVRCINCGGDGRVKTSHGEHVECSECGGTGKIKLNALKREPPSFSNQTLDYFGKRFNWNYLKLISKAVKVFWGDWRVAPGRNIGDDEDSFVPTVFSNADGVKIGLMGIKK